INKLGHKIDKEIGRNDIRLTIGGEPTFISTENRDAPEWNTEALGDEKREKSVELLLRLKENFAPEGSLHFGQGKWYGGEALPRWALGCFYRKDKQPVWKNPKLIAEDKKNYKIKTQQAADFISSLTAALGINKEVIIPASDNGKIKGYVLPLIYGI